MLGEMGNEMTFVEVTPGRVLAHLRSGGARASGYLLESWSDDGGQTWSVPLQTWIWGYPAHLLRLRDGRLLCSYGYRREPMGVRACLSEDGGQTWDVEHEIVLRDDGKPGGDIGYPMSVELPDTSILTVYYITVEDGITHVAATKWRVDEDERSSTTRGSKR
jgi:hypothetical protein